MRIYRQIDMTKLRVAFRNFSKAPKKKMGDGNKTERWGTHGSHNVTWFMGCRVPNSVIARSLKIWQDVLLVVMCPCCPCTLRTDSCELPHCCLAGHSDLGLVLLHSRKRGSRWLLQSFKHFQGHIPPAGVSWQAVLMRVQFLGGHCQYH
jgi:hypothetical protein